MTATNPLAQQIERDEQKITIVNSILAHALYETKKRIASLSTEELYETQVDSVINELKKYDSSIVFEAFATVEKVLDEAENRDRLHDVENPIALYNITMTSISMCIMTRYYEVYTYNKA